VALFVYGVANAHVTQVLRREGLDQGRWSSPLVGRAFPIFLAVLAYGNLPLIFVINAPFTLISGNPVVAGSVQVACALGLAYAGVQIPEKRWLHFLSDGLRERVQVVVWICLMSATSVFLGLLTNSAFLALTVFALGSFRVFGHFKQFVPEFDVTRTGQVATWAALGLLFLTVLDLGAVFFPTTSLGLHLLSAALAAQGLFLVLGAVQLTPHARSHEVQATASVTATVLVLVGLLDIGFAPETATVTCLATLTVTTATSWNHYRRPLGFWVLLAATAGVAFSLIPFPLADITVGLMALAFGALVFFGFTHVLRDQTSKSDDPEPMTLKELPPLLYLLPSRQQSYLADFFAWQGVGAATGALIGHLLFLYAVAVSTGPSSLAIGVLNSLLAVPLTYFLITAAATKHLGTALPAVDPATLRQLQERIRTGTGIYVYCAIPGIVALSILLPVLASGLPVLLKVAVLPLVAGALMALELLVVDARHVHLLEEDVRKRWLSWALLVLATSLFLFVYAITHWVLASAFTTLVTLRFAGHLRADDFPKSLGTRLFTVLEGTLLGVLWVVPLEMLHARLSGVGALWVAALSLAFWAHVQWQTNLLPTLERWNVRLLVVSSWLTTAAAATLVTLSPAFGITQVLWIALVLTTWMTFHRYIPKLYGPVGTVMAWESRLLELFTLERLAILLISELAGLAGSIMGTLLVTSGSVEWLSWPLVVCVVVLVGSVVFSFLVHIEPVLPTATHDKLHRGGTLAAGFFGALASALAANQILLLSPAPPLVRSCVVALVGTAVGAICLLPQLKRRDANEVAYLALVVESLVLIYGLGWTTLGGVWVVGSVLGFLLLFHFEAVEKLLRQLVDDLLGLVRLLFTRLRDVWKVLVSQIRIHWLPLWVIVDLVVSLGIGIVLLSTALPMIAAVLLASTLGVAGLYPLVFRRGEDQKPKVFTARVVYCFATYAGLVGTLYTSGALAPTLLSLLVVAEVFMGILVYVVRRAETAYQLPIVWRFWTAAATTGLGIALVYYIYDILFS
jgi:hypothetical protein